MTVPREMTAARAVLRMMREALEQYLPIPSEEAVNATRGVAYTDEAEELVEGIHPLWKIERPVNWTDGAAQF